jgi:methenyltetrahydromethanopterin cyclohydrolase
VAISPTLNERALRLADHMSANAAALRIAVTQTSAGARIIDCGISMAGGLQAGLAMARVMLAGMGDVTMVPGEIAGFPSVTVQVMTDFPVLACLASQYAGWQISVGDNFAMGSGPMRAHYGKEALFDQIGCKEQANVAVGALETRLPPDRSVISYLSDALKLPANKLTLLVAPAASMAGNLQVVARSLETALHKLHALKFDLSQIVSGFGSAPLPPVAKNEAQAIGRTNDAILYGGRAILWVRADDDQLAQIGPKIPSTASKDHGAPFADIMTKAGHDFYKIDPLLFSPAMVVFHNLKTGKTHGFGRMEPEILLRSFLV